MVRKLTGIDLELQETSKNKGIDYQTVVKLKEQLQNNFESALKNKVFLNSLIQKFRLVQLKLTYLPSKVTLLTIPNNLLKICDSDLELIQETILTRIDRVFFTL